MAGALKRGSLIVFEGCDLSGKTTQVTKLMEKLNREGKPAKMLRFTDRTTGIGSIVNYYLTCANLHCNNISVGWRCTKALDDHAAHLVFSANRWELEQDILSTLNAGTHVIIDRYVYSGVAFSAAKLSLSLSWCKQPDIGLPRPDMVCFLDVSKEVAMKRANIAGEEYNLTEFQRKLRENYTRLRDPSWVTVNADRTMEQVESELSKIVWEEVGKQDRKEVGKLWVEELDERDCEMDEKLIKAF